MMKEKDLSGKRIRQIVAAAMFAALICAATMVIKFPSPMAGGYINLGDCIVLLGCWMLGPWSGGAAAGIGSMLADILTGFASYAPGTFVIKALMAVIAGLIYRMLKKSGDMLVPGLISGVAGEIIMVFGYFFYSSVILGFGLAAAENIPFDAIQGAGGIVFSLLAAGVLNKHNLLGRFL